MGQSYLSDELRERIRAHARSLPDTPPHLIETLRRIFAERPPSDSSKGVAA